MIKNKNIDPSAGLTPGKFTLASAKVIVGNASGVGAAVTLSGDVTNDNAGTTAIGAGKVTQAMHVAASLDGTVAKVAANANVIGGLPVLHRVDIADGASADTDVVLTHKTRVTDVWLVKTGAAGGASDTITVKNGATAITDAIDINVADKTVKRAGTIDDAQHDIAAAGTLRVSMAKASANNTACTVYVLGLRVA